jgi:branched-chain amino acid transport system permease protein
MWFLSKTPFGQIQVGIRDNPKRIDYLGYKVPHTKTVVYIVSGAFAGIAGAVYGITQNLVTADGSLSMRISIYPIITTMIGGIGSFVGPIMGTAIFQIIDELIQSFTDEVELIMGGILVVVVMFAPDGFMGLFTKLKNKFSKRSNPSPDLSI